MDIIEPVRFFYAADPRLGKPLRFGEGGGAFAPLFRDAAYETVRRLVDCALSRTVDFVFLKGELCDVYCDAGALLFLMRQTMRLSRAGIACYILNEGTYIGTERRSGFPLGVKWLNSASTVTCGGRELSISKITEHALMGEVSSPLQGITPDESGPCGAWFVSVTDTGLSEREFIELDTLRWEKCELDVSAIETEDDLTTAWMTVKGNFRRRGQESARPTLLNLKLTGAMKDRVLFYGENFIRARAHEFLIEKLNSNEKNRKDCVLVDSLDQEHCSVPVARTDKEDEDCGKGADTGEVNAKRIEALRVDFLNEVNFFKSGLDLRVGLLEALKERGDYKRILGTDAAPFLENITEADVESFLREACDMAEHWFFNTGRRQSENF